MKLPIPPISINSLISIFFISIFLLFLHPFEGGGDFYHHVNTGKQIIELKSFPFTDIYTHTAQGQPWIAYAWGSGIIFYVIYTLFAETGISILVSLTGTLTLLLLYYFARSLRISKPISLLVVLLVTGPVLTRFPNRPEIFTYPLILGLLLVDAYRTKFPKLNFLFPLIILLWANLYGSSVISGLCLILLFAIKQFLTSPTSRISLISLIPLISLPISLISPNTYKTLFYMFIYIPKVSEYEGEWAGIWTILKYTNDSYVLLFQYLFLIYFIFLTLFFLTLIFGFKHLLKQKLLILLSFSAFIPIFVFRHFPLAALLTAPLIAYLLNRQKSKILNGLVLAGSLIMISLMIWMKPVGMKVDTYQQDQLVQFLKAKGFSGKVFNHSTTGSFLSYKLYPQVKVFFDTRDDLFKESAALDDLLKSHGSSQSILPLLEKYQIDIVVGDFFNDALNYKELFHSNSWAVVYFDDRFLVAVPTAKANEKGLNILTAIDPYSQTGAKPGFEEDAEKYFKSLQPSNSNLLLLAQNLLAQNKNDEAINALQNLKTSSHPSESIIKKQQYYFLAKAYFQNEDCAGFGESLEKLNEEISNKFILDPSRKLPVVDDDLKAYFAILCKKNKQESDFYMKKYLNRPDINPKDKIKFQQYLSGFLR